MSDKNLFPITIASSSVQFWQDSRVVKPSKKAKDEAVKAGKTPPEDKQHLSLTPDFSDAANTLAFISAFRTAAETKKAGSFEELMRKIFRPHLEDATEKAFVTEADGSVNVDDEKFINALVSLDSGGQKSISALKDEERSLYAEIVELFQLAQKGGSAIVEAGYSDEDALHLVISNKSNDLHKLQVVIEARERARDEKAKKNAEKKKVSEPAA